jgi:D-arabinose 1-dehydrogenase-like Zn-dependent alcohol dehydrogenase
MQPSRAMPGKFLSIKFVAGNKPATWRSAVLSLTSVLVVGRDHFDSVFLIKMSVSARDKRHLSAKVEWRVRSNRHCSERGDEGIARIKDITEGVGADSVLECVGTLDSMMQAIRSTRPGGSVGYVGVPHGANLDLQQVFFTLVRLHGGPAPVRRYLPDLLKLVLDGKINPGKVFDLTLPPAQVAEGYRAMDQRRAIKTLLQPDGRN